MKEIYVSTDIEADGPIPGPNSMLSFGSVAFDLTDPENPVVVGEFSRNLVEINGSSPDPTTMSEFWDKNPEAWAACHENQVPAVPAMLEYVAWLKALPGKPIFVGYPGSYDFMWVYWYLINFAGESPFKFQGIDAKTYACAYLRIPFTDVGKRTMPKGWFDPSLKHTHQALDDAHEQGIMFARMRAANLRLP
jgi:hypothetical protein